MKLFIDDGGKAGGRLPVVLLHSAAGNTTQFEHQLAFSRGARRAVAVDLPGHGRSPEAKTLEVEDVAAEVAASLEGLRLGRFVLVGHSWGGAIAAALAARLPAQVAGLFLLDAASDGRLMPKPVADGLLASLAADYQNVAKGYWVSLIAASGPAVQVRVLADLEATAPGVVVGTLRSLLTFDPVSALKRYPGPKEGLITALNERDDAYHREVPFPVTCVEAGHWLQLDQPEVVSRAIEAFAARCDGAELA